MNKKAVLILFGCMLGSFTFCIIIASLFISKADPAKDFSVAVERGHIVPGVVFTGARERLEKGLELYLRGQVSHLLIIGEDEPYKIKELVRATGITSRRDFKDIVFAYNVANTNDSAKAAIEWMEDTMPGQSSAAIITSGFHMNRVLQLMRANGAGDFTLYRQDVHHHHTRKQEWLEYLKRIATFWGIAGIKGYQIRGA